MQRKDISIQYTFDLTTIYPDNQSFTADFDKVSRLKEDLKQAKDSFTINSDNFYAFLKNQDEYSKLLEKLYTYCHLACDVEPENQELQSLMAKVMAFANQGNVELNFIDLKIIEASETINGYLSEDRFASYRYAIKEIIKFKEHLLSEENEQLIAQFDAISSLSSKVFDSIRFDYEPVEINGKKEFLNAATLTRFLKNKDRNVRKQAYHNFFQEYRKFENTFATTLAGIMKKDAIYAKIRKFDSPLGASVYHDDVPEDLFFKILEMANVKYRPLFHQYNSLKKELLDLDELCNYDLNIPLVNTSDYKVKVDDAFEIIKTALAPLGKDYLKIIEKSKDERWIDFYPHEKKRAGAYSGGSYLTKPFILMNYVDDYNSLSTLIHELGHSVHSYLSNSNQEYINSSYRIFVAEVASTVNETLLINHMIANAKTPEQKAYFIYEQLENCVGLLFRQPMYGEFEYLLHQKAAADEPLSSKTITELYAKLSQEYFGEEVKLDGLTGHSCYYIPHFYYNFYVYKYTLGMTVALAIVKRILDGDKGQVASYLEFLKSGGSMSPVDLLKIAHVDPLDDGIYNDAFSYFENLLQQFKETMHEKK
ncbi:MAG: oligoendopeptidase F [Erysipelotrichaceae bacterium]|nr:oligoendopeptidase F [Erysipelotrichaceae bacterium]MDD3809989.1 oligoendopeptidase F [Erysipelotrichaceae bacterium]